MWNDGWFKTDRRLLMVTLSSAMVIDGMNKKSEILNDFSKTEITPEIKTKYEDL